jgi:hypothetical protein
MTYIYRTAQQILDIASDLTSVRLIIAQVQAALLGGSTSGTQSYTFGSAGGTGIQKEVFMSAMELTDVLMRLEAKRDRLQRMSDGTTNQSVRFRRPF